MSVLKMIGLGGLQHNPNAGSNSEGRQAIRDMGFTTSGDVYVFSGAQNGGRNAIMLFDGGGSTPGQLSWTETKKGGFLGLGFAFSIAGPIKSGGNKNILSVAGSPAVSVDENLEVVFGHNPVVRSGVIIQRDVYYFIDVALSGTEVIVSLNNTELGRYPGTFADDTAVPLMIGNDPVSVVAQAQLRITDILTNDGTTTHGPTLAARVGPVKVTTRLPTANSTPLQWTPTPGSDHFECVNAQDAKNITSQSFSGDAILDMFTSSQTVEAGILAMQPFAIAKQEGTAGAITFSLVQQAGASQESSDISLTDKDVYVRAPVATKLPGGGDISSGLASLQFGVKVR